MALADLEALVELGSHLGRCTWLAFLSMSCLFTISVVEMGMHMRTRVDCCMSCRNMRVSNRDVYRPV